MTTIATNPAANDRATPLSAQGFDTLIDTGFDLLDVVEEETALLLATRTRDAVALAPRKTALAATYGGLSRRVKDHGVPVDVTDDALDDLADLSDRLTVAVKDNAKALKDVMTANQRLIDLVVNATRRAQAESGPGTYTDKGRSATRAGPGSPAALNQAL